MKIVVCDDSMEDLVEIEGLLEEYKKNNTDIKFDVIRFTDSSALYQKIQEGELGDIYILDMIMSDKTGIDIGSLIRSTNERSVIIYITSSDDYALEAYGVRAVRYLLKPVRGELFFEALDYAVSDAAKVKKDAEYPVKTKEGLVFVPYSKIEYIENYSRVLNVWLTDGKIVKSIFIRKSFDEEVKVIAEDRNFLQVHKSFLVNLNYVKKLASGNIVMHSGRSIPVSRTRAADVKKEYLLFVSSQYRQGG
ncbi:MAG: LytTR family DNA-binding domain-containing protein [Lachnospiraceae bacterium]|nr:LytTR family DNA-binding domain-containing protein [Lachnospiraceae bacterium]